MENIKVSVIGLGYIGLPTALMLAKSGLNVVGTDYNFNLINTLKQGKLTFKENGLEELFQIAKKNNIEFNTKYVKSNIYIIAVPTPFINSTKKIDTKYLLSAMNSVLDICDKGSVIIVESTISPGTFDKYLRPEVENRGYVIGEDIHFAHAPERIIPGNMIYELVNNSRTIGVDNSLIGNKVSDLYKTFCKGEIVITDIRSAEMTKVVENTFRDVNIAFANELARICSSDKMDVYEIIRIANKHPRVNILQPGPGVGGHCISVDPWFLVGDYPDLTNLISIARNVNDNMPKHVIHRIKEIMKENNINNLARVGLYGLTYKENVDDTRESPTLQLLKILEDNLAVGIKVFDPFVSLDAYKFSYTDFNKFLEEIDLVVIMVSHNHIKNNLDKLCSKIILDTRNICESNKTYKL